MKKDVKVFSTQTCPYCKMVAKSGQRGAPQLWIDDQVIVGFNATAINQALGL